MDKVPINNSLIFVRHSTSSVQHRVSKSSRVISSILKVSCSFVELSVLPFTIEFHGLFIVDIGSFSMRDNYAQRFIKVVFSPIFTMIIFEYGAKIEARI